jgi:hypothetical protein
VRTRTSLIAAAALLTATVWAADTAAPALARSSAPSGAGSSAAHALKGATCSPRARIDGYSDSLNKTSFHGAPVAGISALARYGGGRTLALSDRSELFSLRVRPHGAPTARTAKAVKLADEKGRPLDSEGMTVLRDGGLLVSSETDPSIRRYTPDGRLTGSLPVPHALRVSPEGRGQRNKTFEGVTTPDGGRTVVASMEDKLTGDGDDAQGGPLARLVSWDRRRDGHYEAPRQWAYPVDKTLGISDIAATGDGRLLVLERGYDEHTEANTIRLYLADPRGASDVSGRPKLRAGADVPQGTRAPRLVRKSLLVDMAHCPDLGAPNPSRQPNPLLDNVEALTLRGHAPGGRLRLLLGSDNNESAEQVTRLYAMTVRVPPKPLVRPEPGRGAAQDLSDK